MTKKLNFIIIIPLAALAVVLLIVGVTAILNAVISANNNPKVQRFTQVRDALSLPDSLTLVSSTNQFFAVGVPDGMLFDYSYIIDSTALHQQLKDLLEKDGYKIADDRIGTIGEKVDWSIKGQSAKYYILVSTNNGNPSNHISLIVRDIK